MTMLYMYYNMHVNYINIVNNVISENIYNKKIKKQKQEK